MTILSLISSEGHYGVENMLVSLAKKLSRLRCSNIVGVFEDSRYPHLEVAEAARAQNLNVEIVPCKGRWDWKTVSRIRQLMAKHKIDILHPHGYKADLYALAASRGERVGLVATSHNWPSKLLSMRAYAALDRFVLGRFDRVAVVSDVVAARLRRSGVCANKIAMIVNGVDTSEFAGAAPTLREELGCGKAPLVGFVGRLVPDKGGAILLQAAAKVLTVCPETKFVFVGEGPCRSEWEAAAAELGIRDSLIFAGVRKDMPGVYASFDAVVLPSFVESMPMCLLEAMASSRPVIATKVGAIPRLVLPEETGLLVEPRDVDALAAAILRILQDSNLARQLGGGGRALVCQEFSADAMAKRYIDLYRQVLTNQRKSAQNQAAWELSC